MPRGRRRRGLILRPRHPSARARRRRRWVVGIRSRGLVVGRGGVSVEGGSGRHFAIADHADRRRSDDEDEGGRPGHREAASSTARHEATVTERLLDQGPGGRGERDREHRQPDPDREVVAGGTALGDRRGRARPARGPGSASATGTASTRSGRASGAASSRGRPSPATRRPHRMRSGRAAPSVGSNEARPGYAVVGPIATRLAASSAGPEPAGRGRDWAWRASRAWARRTRAVRPPRAARRGSAASSTPRRSAMSVIARDRTNEPARTAAARVGIASRGRREPRHDQQQDRPQEIELLLDRQRPVVEHRRGIDRGEVVGGVHGEAHVRERQAGRQALVGDPPEVQRRQDELGRQRVSWRAPERRRAGCVVPDGRRTRRCRSVRCARRSFDEQASDQEAGQDEEDVDADEAGLGARDADMTEQDEQDRDAAQTLEVWPIPRIAGARRRHQVSRYPPRVTARAVPDRCRPHVRGLAEVTRMITGDPTTGPSAASGHTTTAIDWRHRDKRALRSTTRG